MNQINKIAIIGGTGKAGQYLVKQSIHKNYSLKLLLRNPEKQQYNSPLVEIVKGDARNYESVLSLIKDCDSVISTIGQSKGEPPIFSLVTSHIIRAMKELKIKRYITITGITLDTPGDKKSFRTKLLSKVMKISFPAIIADKQKEYALLAETMLDWTVVRIPLIKETDKLLTVKTSLIDCQGKSISSSELANFLISQLSDTSYFRKAPFIANP